MKTICVIASSVQRYGKQLGLLMFFILSSVITYGQRTDDRHVTTEFNYDSREIPWYGQPWIWAIVASFLILLIAFLSKDYLKKHMEDDSEAGTTH